MKLGLILGCGLLIQQAHGVFVDDGSDDHPDRQQIKRGLQNQNCWIASTKILVDGDLEDCDECYESGSCDDLQDRIFGLQADIDGGIRASDDGEAMLITEACFVTFCGSDDLKEAVEDIENVDVDPDWLMIAEARPASWGLDRIDQAGPILDGDTFKSSHTGIGVNVYIVDTGINNIHNDFGGRAYIGGDFINEDTDVDANGHGSHCAGTVGSNTYGIAREATLYGVKVLSARGSGSTSGVINGIKWAVDHQRKNGGGTGVISMSLGGGKSSSMNKAASDAAKTMIVVVAAGNENQDACNVSPASAGGSGSRGGVITVGSTMISSKKDKRSSFSNYGSCVDVFAPGSNIKSVWKGSKTATNTISGTSMATPHVAGVAAVLLDKHSGDKDAAISELFALTRGGLIQDVKSAADKLLQVPIYSGPPTPPTPAPSMPPTYAPATLCCNGKCVEFAGSTFGPSVPEDDLISAPLVVAREDPLMCKAVSEDYSDKIVIVNRGDCYFFDKVKNAEASGAVAVLIALTVKNLVIFPPAYYGNEEVGIPSAMISFDSAKTLRNQEGKMCGLGSLTVTQAPTAPTPPTLSPTSTPTFSPTPAPTKLCSKLNKKQCNGRDDCVYGKFDGKNRCVERSETRAPTPAPTKICSKLNKKQCNGRDDCLYGKVNGKNRCVERPTGPTLSPTPAPTKLCSKLNKKQCNGRDDCVYGKFNGKNKCVERSETRAPTPAPTKICSKLNKKQCNGRDDCLYGKVNGKNRCYDKPVEEPEDDEAEDDEAEDDEAEDDEAEDDEVTESPTPAPDGPFTPPECVKGNLGTALSLCAEYGMGLCSAAELKAAPYDEECAFDRQFVWTTDRCSKGRSRVVRRIKASTKCVGPKKKYAVRCC